MKKPAILRLLVIVAMGALPLAVSAARFEGVVTHVTDGDSVWVRPADGAAPREIRINGIDAPEICQAFGAEARDALSRRVLHQRVVVVVHGEDDYHRTIARISLGHEDVGAWMVKSGYAWSYRFRGNPGPYRHFEARARTAHRGLWGANGRPEAPRDFRVRHGSCRPALSALPSSHG
jgi:micrococcal nuclease